MNLERGRFITLEGGEGCGKSTQLSLLIEALRLQGRQVIALREPGGTPLSESIRHLLKHAAEGEGMCAEAELLLMNASRAQLVREVLLPALDAGQWVVCDRFFDSTLAYQGYGRRLNLESVEQIIHFATGGLKPDRTLLLELPEAEASLRRRSREQDLQEAPDRMERSGEPFFRRVHEGFRQLAARDPERIRIVDASGSQHAVTSRLLEALQGL